ncbi:MAG: protein phosphatase [Selenomonadaceae bacterium]|nr:protein phosphatase [Selenomonadaceae bacterium]
MRKSNSIFKTAFISESGAELTNNDYFAFVELDDFACYVLASGITDFKSSIAAQEAVEHLILSFEEKPSMAKTSLRQYMIETNQRLLNANTSQRLKASVIMIATDYEKFRYAAAGNVRLRMYRQGRFILQSDDMSLAKDLIDSGKSDTLLDKHEERHNLYAYLGKKDYFQPFVSKRYKLMDADIIALYSQGLWENVDEQEIDEVFTEAKDEPRESVDLLEELLLSRQPNDLKSYTIAAIFVNKSYRDPERERKRLRMIKIAIIAFILIILVGLIIWYLNYRHQKQIEELNDIMDDVKKYMLAENYPRAQESCQDALKRAESLDRETDEQHMRNYLLIIDSIIKADELSESKHYNTAYDVYLTALNYSRKGDNMGYDYIQRRLSRVEEHIGVEDFIELGDKHFDAGELDEAEQEYLKAKDKAAAVRDPERKAEAMAALDKIYDKRAKMREDAEKRMNENRQSALADALRKGDELLAEGNFDGARDAYLSARALANDSAERQETSANLEKVIEAKREKQQADLQDDEEYLRQLNNAIQYANKGDEAFTAKDYVSAQMYYQTAREKFTAIYKIDESNSMKDKYDLAGVKLSEILNQRREAENTEQRARELYNDRNFSAAKQMANQAKQLFSKMDMKGKVEEMEILIEQITTDAIIADNLK